MGTVSDYVFVLPAVIAAGWILSWWGSQRGRWVLLSAAAVLCVLGVVIGIVTKAPPGTPQNVGCVQGVTCADPRPLYWVVAGLLGLGCCFVLLVVTVVVELVRIGWASRTPSPFVPRSADRRDGA